jgi:hypothetical protein
MAKCVNEWLQIKFLSEKKKALRQKLAPGPWRLELVVHRLKHPEELEVIRSNGIVVHELRDVVRDVLAAKNLLEAAAGQSLIELIAFDKRRP